MLSVPFDEELYQVFRHGTDADHLVSMNTRNHTIYDVLMSIWARTRPPPSPQLLNEAKISSVNFMDLCQNVTLCKLFYMQQVNAQGPLEWNILQVSSFGQADWAMEFTYQRATNDYVPQASNDRPKESPTDILSGTGQKFRDRAPGPLSLHTNIESFINGPRSSSIAPQRKKTHLRTSGRMKERWICRVCSSAETGQVSNERNEGNGGWRELRWWTIRHRFIVNTYHSILSSTIFWIKREVFTWTR